MRRTIVISLLALSFGHPVAAQIWDRMTTPQLPVTLRHPPVVKVPLEHVAFVQAEGPCADTLVAALMSDFTSSGATVLDRAHFAAMDTEHKLNTSLKFDAATVAKIGGRIGSGTLMFVKVHECAVTHAQSEQNVTDKNGATRTIRTTKTHGVLRASIQATNLTTGVTLGAPVVIATTDYPREDNAKAGFGARLLSATASALTSGTGRDPGAIQDDEVITELEADAVQQAHQVFLPWTETRKLHFYEDKECGIGTAVRFLRGGDNDVAASEAQASLDTCKQSNAKPVTMAHAYYNVGMTQFLVGNYDAALVALAQAVRLDGNSIITEAMSECHRAQALARELASRQQLPEERARASADTRPSVTASPSKATATAEERLQRLESLHKKGIITDEEYKAKRAEILKDM